LLGMTPLLLAAGCMNGANPEAICAGTLEARTAHVKALVQDGGDRSVVTGARLVRLLDAGCGDA
jgi:hypothetical protein